MQFTPEQQTQQQQELDIAERALMELEVQSRPKLKEEIFVSVFLPMFANDAEREYKVDIRNWVAVSKTPLYPVDIVDENGKVLFTVPPLIDTNAVASSIEFGPASMTHVVKTLQQLNNHNPNDGERYLAAQMERRKLFSDLDVAAIEHLKVWDQIFRRYQRKPILPDEVVETQAAESTKPSDDDYVFTLA